MNEFGAWFVIFASWVLSILVEYSRAQDRIERGTSTATRYSNDYPYMHEKIVTIDKSLASPPNWIDKLLWFYIIGVPVVLVFAAIVTLVIG